MGHPFQKQKGKCCELSYLRATLVVVSVQHPVAGTLFSKAAHKESCPASIDRTWTGPIFVVAPSQRRITSVIYKDNNLIYVEAQKEDFE